MTTETVQMPVMTVEKKPEKVKLTKEERAAKKAAAELEKKQKAEERAAKKAATELEKKQKADIRAAKKAAKEEKKKTAAEINLPSSLQIQLGEIRDNHEKIKEKTAEDKELQLEEPVKSAEPEEPEEEEEEDQCLPFDPAAAALVDKVLESSTHSSGNENDTNTPPNSPHRVVAETSPIGDDDSVECDFRAVEGKLQIMKKIILTTRANLTQLETCYSELANLIGTDATL